MVVALAVLCAARLDRFKLVPDPLDITANVRSYRRLMYPMG